MVTLMVGIDVSKEKLDVALMLQQDLQHEKFATDLGEFANDGKFKSLKKAVVKYTKKVSAQSIHIILEPSGGYQTQLANFAHKEGWKVSMPNPKQIKSWKEGNGERTKTDKVDARALAEFGCYSRKLLEWKPLPEEVAELDDMLRRKQALEKTLRQEKNRLHAWKSQGHSTDPVSKSFESLISVLKEQIKLIDKVMISHINSHQNLKEKYSLLITIPGVGKVNGVFLTVLLYQWSCFTDGRGTRQGLTAYVGYDPKQNQSGTSVNMPPRISRQGRNLYRVLLFMGAMGGLRKKGDNPLRVFYLRLVSRGKKKKVALTAAARKILVWAWAVFCSDMPFDESKAFAKN
jgi:transposase